jgi:hypothetical protein
MAVMEFDYGEYWTATFTAPVFECKPFVLTRAQRKRFALALIRKQRFF